MKKSVFLLASLFNVTACAQPAMNIAVSTSPSVEKTAQANAERWPAAKSPDAITSIATESQITALLARMTVAQKVGQVIQADISAIKPEDLAHYPLGSILAGGNSGPFGDERGNAAKWNKMVDQFRTASVKAGANIPILFGVDAVHGHSNLPGATIFPHNIGLGAARDTDLVRRIGVATAAEIAGSGIEWTFAPTLAIPQDLRWGRSYEGYSSDPAIVAEYARAMTLGLQGQLQAGQPLGARQVAATAKHFLADGGTAEGRDQGDARMSEQELIAGHSAGYPPSIEAGALTVMASFSSWNGVKHHGNKSLLTDVLKQRMGFKGLVVGDWNGHGQVTGCSATDCAASLNAGIDLFMAPDSWKGLFDSTVKAVNDGRITMERLDDAVRRILRVKHKLGLMGDIAVVRSDHEQVGAAAHLELAREAVAKSLVLLKNEKGLLPIKPGSRVLIAGSGAENMAMQAGGWTITWQGTDTKASDFPNGQTIGKAIAEAVGRAGGQTEISSDGFGNGADVAIVIVGENPYAEFQGDVPDLAFRPLQNDENLIARLKEKGIPVVTVFLSGRPLFTGKQINQSDAFVAAWLPGTQARGIADVLVARADGKPLRDFVGRLPFAWPADARSPIKNPLFPIGYGLSYAKPQMVARVNEEPRVDLSLVNNATSYLSRGRVPAPWRLVIDGSVTAKFVDLSAQEDAQRFSWNRQGAVAIEGGPVDLSRQLDQSWILVLDWRIDQAGTAPVQLSMAGGTVDISNEIRTAVPGKTFETRIPLHCFKATGASFNNVGVPIRIAADTGFTATLRTVKIAAIGEMLHCPGKAN
ncbi:MAG: glycoside hydrolase family 3 N-terminal domain-containing protein [Sphingorhabdus sp.]